MEINKVFENYPDVHSVTNEIQLDQHHSMSSQKCEARPSRKMIVR